MTKRRHAYLIIAAMGLGLTGCGINNEADTVSEATTEAIVVTEAETITTEATTEQISKDIKKKDDKLTASESDSSVKKTYIYGLDNKNRKNQFEKMAKSVETELGKDAEIILTVPVDNEEIEKEDAQDAYDIIGKYIFFGFKKDGDTIKTTGTFTGIAKMDAFIKNSTEYDVKDIKWAKKDTLEEDVEAMCEGHDGLSDRLISADEKDSEIIEYASKAVAEYLNNNDMKDIKTIDIDGNTFDYDINSDSSSNETDSSSDEETTTESEEETTTESTEESTEEEPSEEETEESSEESTEEETTESEEE